MTTLIWTFALIMFASIIIGWAAEVTAIYLSAGIALAVLAWLQTAPEFAVEAVIAWSRNSDLVLANLTGSLRLLMGFGWPMVFFVHWYCHRKSKKKSGKEITLPLHFSVEVGSLFLSVLYFFKIWITGRWSVFDGIVLILLYTFYFYILNRQRKLGLEIEEEEEEDAPFVVQKILGLSKAPRLFATLGIFALGGGALVFAVHPFLDALKEVAITLGVSQYVFVQWVAPIATELPEKITAFNWARKSSKVSLAIVNMLSSVVSQWTLMAGLVPIVYSISGGEWGAIELTSFQKSEVLLTISQSLLAVLFLTDLRMTALEMLAFFTLWVVQFIIPTSRDALVYVYLSWIFLELIKIALQPSRLVVLRVWKKIIFPAKS